MWVNRFPIKDLVRHRLIPARATKAETLAELLSYFRVSSPAARAVPAATRILATEDARGRAFEEVFSTDPVLLDGVRGAFRSGSVWTSPRRAIRLREGSSSGDERMYRFIAVPTRMDGTPEGVVLYAADVTGLSGDAS